MTETSHDSGGTPAASTTLDCRGLACPEPIVRLFLAIRRLDPGAAIRVEATDPALESDLRAWSEMTGHRIIEFVRGDPHRAVVEKSGLAP